jgi:hypothetical protein
MQERYLADVRDSPGETVDASRGRETPEINVYHTYNFGIKAFKFNIQRYATYYLHLLAFVP